MYISSNITIDITGIHRAVDRGSVRRVPPCPEFSSNTCTAAFPKLFSSGDHFYQSECSTDHPTLFPLWKQIKILNYSVWYAIHVNFIFSVFFGLIFNLRGPQGQNPRTTVWETLLYSTHSIELKTQTQLVSITVGPSLTNSIRSQGLVVTQVGRNSRLFFP
jgi:hypothetical protein